MASSFNWDYVSKCKAGTPRPVVIKLQQCLENGVLTDCTRRMPLGRQGNPVACRRALWLCRQSTASPAASSWGSASRPAASVPVCRTCTCSDNLQLLNPAAPGIVYGTQSCNSRAPSTRFRMQTASEDHRGHPDRSNQAKSVPATIGSSGPI